MCLSPMPSAIERGSIDIGFITPKALTALRRRMVDGSLGGGHDYDIQVRFCNNRYVAAHSRTRSCASPIS